MAYVYHEIDPAQLDSILADGLLRSSTGSKTNDIAIIKTDQLLDRYRPDNLRNAGVSRENNLYGYFTVDNKIADIITGQLVAVSDFVAKSDQAVLRLTIDPSYCYVSDLDLYDNIRIIIEANDHDPTLPDLARSYWDNLLPFIGFEKSIINRPEIMITYDIKPPDITVMQ
jgi:hypothetical protein